VKTVHIALSYSGGSGKTRLSVDIASVLKCKIIEYTPVSDLDNFKGLYEIEKIGMNTPIESFFDNIEHLFSTNSPKDIVIDTDKSISVSMVEYLKTEKETLFKRFEKNNIKIVFHLVVSLYGLRTSLDILLDIFSSSLKEFLPDKSVVLWLNYYFKDTNFENVDMWVNKEYGLDRCLKKIGIFNYGKYTKLTKKSIERRAKYSTYSFFLDGRSKDNSDALDRDRISNILKQITMQINSLYK